MKNKKIPHCRNRSKIQKKNRRKRLWPASTNESIIKIYKNMFALVVLSKKSLKMPKVIRIRNSKVRQNNCQKKNGKSDLNNTAYKTKDPTK